MTKQELIKSLRQLAIDMYETGHALQAKYPEKPRGAEMIGASEMANEWADEMEKEA